MIARDHAGNALPAPLFDPLADDLSLTSPPPPSYGPLVPDRGWMRAYVAGATSRPDMLRLQARCIGPLWRIDTVKAVTHYLSMHLCPTCEKPVLHRKRKYCSRECHQAQTQRVTASCENCGTSFWRYQSQLDHQAQRGDKRAGKFCSTHCYRISRRGQEEGTSNHPRRSEVLTGVGEDGPALEESPIG